MIKLTAYRFYFCSLFSWDNLFLRHGSPDELQQAMETCIKLLSKPCYADRQEGKENWMVYLSPREQDDLLRAEAGLTIKRVQFSISPTADKLSEIETLRSANRSLLMRFKSLASDRLVQEQRSQALSPSICWKLLKKLRTNSSTIPIQPSKLVQHFLEVFYDDAASLSISYPTTNPLLNAQLTPGHGLEFPFSAVELDQVLAELNLNAATGPDGISAKLLLSIFTSVESRVRLLRFVNECFARGQIPLSWGMSHTTILFKGKGPSQNPDSYRGISVLNASFKIYERLLYHRLLSWAEGNLHLNSSQFGFRKGRSTFDAIFALSELRNFFVDYLGVPFHVVFIDLRKAFPSVKREVLIRFLSSRGVPPILLRAIASIFAHNSTQLKLGSHLTSTIPVNVGLREGGVLSPLLFAILFSVVWDTIGHFKFLKQDGSFSVSNSSIFSFAYADDLAIASSSVSEINDALEKLRCVFEPLGLKVSTEKTKCMSWFPPRRPFSRDQIFLFENAPLERVKEFKYLGFLFSEKRNYRAQLMAVENRLISSNIATIKLLKQLEIVDPKKIRILFLSLVASQMYGTIFLGKDAIRMLEAIKRKFVKFLFALPLSTSNAFCDSLLPLPPCVFSVVKARLNFISRTLEASEFSPTFDVMMASLSYLWPKGKGWFSEFTPICNSINFQFDISWLDDCEKAIQEFSVAATQFRISGHDVYSSMKYAKCLFVDNSFPDEFLRCLFELQGDIRRRVMLMLAGVGRATLLRVPVDSCPMCDDLFTSEHFLSCEFLCFDGGDAEHYFLSCAGRKNWRLACAKLVEICEVWASIPGFLR